MTLQKLASILFVTSALATVGTAHSKHHKDAMTGSFVVFDGRDYKVTSYATDTPLVNAPSAMAVMSNQTSAKDSNLALTLTYTGTTIPVAPALTTWYTQEQAAEKVKAGNHSFKNGFALQTYKGKKVFETMFLHGWISSWKTVAATATQPAQVLITISPLQLQTTAFPGFPKGVPTS